MHITLRDADGVFLEIEPEKIEEPADPGTEMSQDEDGEREEGGETEALHQELAEANQHIEELNAEVRSLREGVEREKARARELWRTSCEQLSEYDSIISEKDAELERLRGKIREMEPHEPDTCPGQVGFIDEYPTPLGMESCTVVPGPTTSHIAPVRRSKAPPVDSFSGDNPDVCFDDWLPTLQRAAT